MIETLLVLALSGCVPDGASVVCPFPAPPELHHRHVRLELACADPVYLNGSSVEGSAQPRPVGEFLIARGGNTLQMPFTCTSAKQPAKLLITPRVYIARILPKGIGLTVTIENTLDNTVSIGLSCHGPAAAATASATIPARGQAELVVPVTAKGKVTCVMEKTPEALEEAYQFQMDAIYQ